MASSLIELVEALRALSADIQVSLSTEAAIAQAEHVLERLLKTLEQLTGPVKALETAHFAGFGPAPSQVPSEPIRQALQEIADTAAAAELDPVGTLTGFRGAGLQTSLVGAASALDRTARETWAAHCAVLMPGPQSVPLRAVQPGLPRSKRNLVDRILTRDLYLASARAIPPQTLADYEKLAQAVKERDEWFSQVDVVRDPEIREFLVNSAGRGVPLAAMTPKITAWLTESGLLDDYVVTPRDMDHE